MTGLLNGIRILDLTTMGTGPYATQILGEFGADIIKLESPQGDTIRGVGPARHAGMSSMFLTITRGKRSLMLDLRRPEARPAFERLVARTDVVIHNMRPKAASKLGLDYADLKTLNEAVVLCAISGFGPGGPYSERPAYDDLIQGLIALPDLSRRAGGDSRYVPLALADRVTGLMAVQGVLAALVARLRTGKGQNVLVPMFEAMAGFVLSDHLYGHTFVPPKGQAGYPRHLNPFRRPYKTRDGFLGVLPYTDRQWRSLFAALGASELAEDPRFTTVSGRTDNIAELYAAIEQHMGERTSEEWLAILAEADVPAMPTHTLDTLLQDPHLLATGFLTEVEHPSEGPVLRMARGVRWDGEEGTERREAPRLGENSAEILAEIGLDRHEIDRLADLGVTGWPRSAG